MTRVVVRLILLLTSMVALLGSVQSTTMVPPQTNASRIDRDLTDVSITQLRSFYAEGTYTVTQVTQWHLDRIARHDKTYQSFLHVDSAGALSAAAAADAVKKKAGSRFNFPLLWGIPVVIKGNTSVKGLVTSNGWQGY